ncbi:alpha- -mannosylglycoprotein 6-beta-n-acetylglucosaminyltransferase b [Limosa lapponica baueri]|uniref:Alpha--mannosylglycoprotein 6-beta-n-acetylglucosaminyltransferase b n=1 Tax=Limosa lapponica baueri TaxID=1758121 RepID=A0A2I0T631_LIMLA|nr:alpha- -mannosylglycoprotein 6-beta-n-acetylglucosaminyltransferase b [Limosa lapponica baueri]
MATWGVRQPLSFPAPPARLLLLPKLNMCRLLKSTLMGALESRGLLRRMSDMLEMLMKRMDILARLENSTDFHKGDEARFPLDRCLYM